MQEVTVVSRRGVPKITVKNVPGKACKDLTRDLESALGDVKETKATQEMFATATKQTKGAGH